MSKETQIFISYLLLFCSCTSVNTSTEEKTEYLANQCYAVFNCEEPYRYFEICFTDSMYSWDELTFFEADVYRVNASGEIHIGNYHADRIHLENGVLSSSVGTVVVPIEFPKDMKRKWLYSRVDGILKRSRAEIGYTRFERMSKNLEAHCD